MNESPAIPNLNEYTPKAEDYVRPKAYQGWFLTERDRRGRISYLAESAYFEDKAQAKVQRDELRAHSGRTRDLSVVECCVIISISEPKNKRIRFEYKPTGATWMRAQSQFEQFWREDTLQRTESILWYAGEFVAMMHSGGVALDATEEKSLRDRHVIPIVRDGGRVEIRPSGLIRQIQQDCRDSVQAHLFHQAVEVGMKVLLAADRIDDLRKGGHKLGDVWQGVSERRRLAVNRIFDKELKDVPPASASFDALVAQYSKGKKGVTGSLRYLGEGRRSPLPDRDIVRHLWKMASALLLYYLCDLAEPAIAAYGVLTDFRDTIH